MSTKVNTRITRSSNFELMRIISMIFIIIWHIYVYGDINGSERIVNTQVKTIINFSQFLLIVHVNSFALLSGYFFDVQKFKSSKLFSIITTTLFYKLLIVGLLIHFGYSSMSNSYALVYFFPLNSTWDINYWYIRIFVLLYMLSPFINMFIKSLDRSNHRKVLIALFFIFSVLPFISGDKLYSNDGFTLSNFILLYVLGAFIKKYIKQPKRISLNLYRLLLLFGFFFIGIVNHSLSITTVHFSTFGDIFHEIFGSISSMLIRYSNPLVIVQSVLFFLFFSTLKIKSKLINIVASTTLGIYLIHNNKFLSEHLYVWLKIDGYKVYSYKFLLYIILVAILIFVASACIELTRQLIVKLIMKLKISKKIRKKLSDYYHSIKIID